MPKEIEIPEELVSEIMMKIASHWSITVRRKETIELITRIAQAIARGEMKLPGEVWRGNAESVSVGQKTIWRGACKLYKFIAFRPEEIEKKEEHK